MAKFSQTTHSKTGCDVIKSLYLILGYQLSLLEFGFFKCMMVHLHDATNDAVLGRRIRFEGQLRLWRQRAQVRQGSAVRLWIYKEAYS